VGTAHLLTATYIRHSMFSDFPNLHPLVVHLPIVLLLLSAGLQALNVYKDWPPVKWITMGVMAGGFLGALAASTIFHAMPMGLAPRAAAVFEAHEKFASYTLWLAGITLLLAGIGAFFKIQRRAYEVLVGGWGGGARPGCYRWPGTVEHSWSMSRAWGRRAACSIKAMATGVGRPCLVWRWKPIRTTRRQGPTTTPRTRRPLRPIQTLPRAPLLCPAWR
jgi:hypothetical protein